MRDALLTPSLNIKYWNRDPKISSTNGKNNYAQPNFDWRSYPKNLGEFSSGPAWQLLSPAAIRELRHRQQRCGDAGGERWHLRTVAVALEIAVVAAFATFTCSWFELSWFPMSLVESGYENPLRLTGFLRIVVKGVSEVTSWFREMAALTSVPQ